MAGVVVFIGSLIVFVTMMGSVNERTVEIGVFRAIGFRKSHIMRIILLEAALVSLLAGLLGCAVGMGGAKLALPFMAESKNAKLLWDGWVAGGSVGWRWCWGFWPACIRHCTHRKWIRPKPCGHYKNIPPRLARTRGD